MNRQSARDVQTLLRYLLGLRTYEEDARTRLELSDIARTAAVALATESSQVLGEGLDDDDVDLAWDELEEPWDDPDFFRPRITDIPDPGAMLSNPDDPAPKGSR